MELNLKKTRQLPPEALAEQAAAQKASEPATEPAPIPEPGSTELPAGLPFSIHPSSEIETEPEETESWLTKLYSKRVVVGSAVAFLAFWLLADYTGWTAGHMRPGQIIYSHEMAQLWTASYRMVFVLAATAALVYLVFPAAIRYWRHDVDPAFSALKDFKLLTPHQRLWYCFALLAFLAYLFVSLLSVKLPELLNVGP